MRVHRVKGRDVSLTSLYPEGDKHSSDTYTLGCGCYEKVWGRWEWTGESIRGSIPVTEFIRWALKRGFAHFEDSDPDRMERMKQLLSEIEQSEQDGPLFARITVTL